MNQLKIKNLRKSFEKNNIDALMVLNEENRKYLSGFNAEDSSFVETAGVLFISHNALILATDSRFTTQAEQEAPLYKTLTYKKSFIKNINEIVKELKIKRLGFEANRLSVFQYEEIKKEIKEIEFIKTENLTENLRAIKNSAEIEKIKRAIQISETSFREIEPFLTEGESEKKVAWEFEKRVREKGGQLAFPTIVAFGENASMPHYLSSNTKISKKTLPLLFDFGVKFNEYCSDTTRTLTLNKNSSTFKKIYNTVLTAQKKAIDAIASGKKASEIDKVARDYISSKGYGDNFLHSLGHGVGLAVHEQPTISSLNNSILKENMIITIEPGIYIKNWGGIRIEDIVLVKKNGAEVLGTLNK